jgi:hypothetical protein
MSGNLNSEHNAGRLYAVVDAAANSAIYPGLLALASVEEITSLYDGNAARVCADAAPYLLALDADGAAATWLAATPWLNDATIFLRSRAAMPEVRTRLRRLTRVGAPDGRVLLFRFYDPIILRAFLPTCDIQQAAEFFDDIDEYLVFDGDVLMRFSRAEDGRIASGRAESLFGTTN